MTPDQIDILQSIFGFLLFAVPFMLARRKEVDQSR